MNRLLTTLALLSAVVLVACDREPAARPVPALATESPTSTATAAAPSQTAARPTPTATTTPVPLLLRMQGEVRPKGRFIVRRGDALWSISFDPEREQRLYVPPAGHGWLYVGFDPRDETFILAEVEPVGSGEGRTVSVVRVRSSGTPERLFSFGLSRSDFISWGPLALAPDARSIAYVDTDGLAIRDLASGAIRWVAPHVPWPCVVQSCMLHLRPWWSPDGRFLLSTGIAYEPVATWVYDMTSIGQAGTRLPFCVGREHEGRWQGTRMVVGDGDCYSTAGQHLYRYDLFTGTKEELRESAEDIRFRELGRPVVGMPDGSTAVLAGRGAIVYVIDQAGRYWSLPIYGAQDTYLVLSE